MPMGVRKVTEELLAHYLRARAVGHTHAALFGVAEQPKARIVVVHESERGHIREQLEKAGWSPELDTADHKVITWTEIRAGHLGGQLYPIIFDNHFAFHLLQDLLGVIVNQETEIADLRAELNHR